MKALLFRILKTCWKNSTIRGQAEKIIKTQYPFLHEISRLNKKEQFTRYISKPKSTLIIVGIIYIAGWRMSLIPEIYITQYVSFLQHIKIHIDKDHDNSFSIMQTMLSTSATIIGLSFVVMSFLIQGIQQTSQQTYRELWRLGKLNRLLVVSLLGVAMLVVLNLVGQSYDPYYSGNLAIYSCFILIAIIISIGDVFYKTLKYIHPDEIAKLLRDSLHKTARLTYYNEQNQIIIESTYMAAIEKHGFTKDSPILFGDAMGLRLPVKDNMFIFDVCTYTLNQVLLKIKTETSSATYIPVKFGTLIVKNSYGIIFPEEFKLNRWYNILWNSAFLTKEADQTTLAFNEQKLALDNRLHEAIKKGNVFETEQALNQLNDLYKIYYQERT